MASQTSTILRAPATEADERNPFLIKLDRVVRLTPNDRQALANACRDVRSIPADRYIARTGDRPGYVHLILEGWAVRCQLLSDGSRQITAFLLPGDLCDQHVTILGAMDHDIRTITPARVAHLPNGELEELARKSPQIARALWWSTLVDEAVLRAWIANIGRREAYQRVGHILCELHVRLENIGLTNGAQFELPVTQEELADALGLTPVHVNRMLRRLREEGLIFTRRPWITLRDIARLREACGFDGAYLDSHLAGANPFPV